jgi:cold shock CspA family protein
MPIGILKNISERGYAFAQTPTGDVFCHANQFVDRSIFPRLVAGDTVSFDIGTGRDGRPVATCIEVVQQ